jgi:NAD(P)H-hydrate epimerase
VLFLFTGTDAVEIERFRRALERHPRLAGRIFTQAELDYCRRFSDPVPHLAVRFAGKEAVGKLLGSGVTCWRDIELRGPGLAEAGVHVLLHGRSAVRARALGVREVAISLYHTDTTAGATAVAAGRAAWSGGLSSGSTTADADLFDGAYEMGSAGNWRHNEERAGVGGPGLGVFLRLMTPAERPRAFTAEQVRELDRFTIEEAGVPGPVLMERAALGVTEFLLRRFPGRHTLIVCGQGNNGGDGLAVARQLHLAGHPVVCAVLAGGEEELSPDARLNAHAAASLGVNLYMGTMPDYVWDETEAVVDCLLGTGATGELRDPILSAAAKINEVGERGIPVVAVDVPTGVDATTGAMAKGAVAADHTVTFHAAKSGLVCPPGSEAVGELVLWDIGLPAFAESGPDVRVVTARDVRVPGRRPDDHKYRAGYLAVVAGSGAYPGAALLTARAAASLGAGYVRLFAPMAVVEPLRVPLTEVVTESVGTGAVLEEADALLEAVADERIGAFAVGPGLGRAAATYDVVRRLVASTVRPLVLDADGLMAFSGSASALAGREGMVLTPHQGELAALLGVPVAEVAQSALSSARRGAALTGQVVVLKGSSTVIASPDGSASVVIQGPPQLASAGTGDVLTGCIGALLAKGLAPREAAEAGVWLHAEAGYRLRTSSPAGIVASALLDVIPAIAGERVAERRPSWT